MKEYLSPITFAVFCATALGASAAELTHRWSFSGDCNDSVTGAAASRDGDGIAFADGQVALKGGPRGTGALTLGENLLDMDAGTIEIWATPTAAGHYARIFDYGADSKNYFAMSWTYGTALDRDLVEARIRQQNAGIRAENTMAPYPLQTPCHIAVTFEKSGTGTKVRWMKRDIPSGKLLRQGTFTASAGSFASFKNPKLLLGRSQFAQDHDAAARYDEVRIWKGALSDAQLSANVALGPDKLPAFAAEKEAYLFSYFRGQADGLHLAVSDDGLNWTALNANKSVLKPTVGKDKLMRDPSICRGPDGVYRMVWTTSWHDRIIGYAETRDFVHWSEQRAIPVMTGEPECRNCWAPELTYDPDTGVYHIYWASTVSGKADGDRAGHRIYRTTTRDFKTFTPTVKAFDPGFSVIDAAVVRDPFSRDWLMVIKDEREKPVPKKHLLTARSTSLDKGFPTALEGPINFGPDWVEGPSPLAVGSEIFVYFDNYRRGRYNAISSPDGGKTWKDRSSELHLPNGIRHGTAIAIPKEEKDALVRRFALPPSEIRLTEGFWRDQYRKLTVKWLPHCIRQMEKGGRGEEILNLVATGEVLAGKKPSVKFKGCMWSDAYPYNILESICLALEIDPGDDPEWLAAQDALRAKLEEWIPVLLAAQEPSGYIHSFHTLNNRPHFTRHTDHEFYVMGYFLELGVAHRRLTAGRDDRLWKAALRLADHLDATFGPAPKRTWMNGHAGIEYALCRLADASGDPKYARLAQFMLHNQSSQEKLRSAYNQSEMPATEMRTATGHAVRAAYFYTGMAGVANRLGDTGLGTAADRLWADILDRQMYLTGGIGSTERGESFGGDWVLPQTAYAESCAGCGLVFFADEMRKRIPTEKAEAVRERALYNNILGAISRDGENFYYQNPLSSSKLRYPWHGCPCCVGNIPRTLLALKDRLWRFDGDTLVLEQFMDHETELKLPQGGTVRVREKTAYPFDGKVTLEFSRPMKVRVRFPDRAESALYRAEPVVEHGYRSFSGEKIAFELPLPLQTVKAIPEVKDCEGRIAHQRGPLVLTRQNGKDIPVYDRLNEKGASCEVWVEEK